ncbi:MAG: 4Fe-4S ferredoxin [Desulfococcus sp. 4484_242]|nr:MAG: 4Fe-4S ferredoxin [Desulfococcus sp. 4484_242]
MDASNVYFCDLRTSMKENLPAKLRRLLDEAGLKEIISARNLVAIKIHFGEKGNTAFIRPVLIRPIVNAVRDLGAAPFLTDANTLYAGTRGNSVSHLITAMENGFAYSVVDAPLIVADGLRGASFKEIAVDKEFIKTAYIGTEIAEADVLVSAAHFKGHELCGFGGTIKNVGMGCASRMGKLEQHSDLSPKVKKKKCVGCGECVDHCARKAISLKEKKAEIDSEKCVGCGECILICPNRAIDVQWNADIPLFQKKMAEYAWAVLKGKKEKSIFLNFLTNITPACDCNPNSDAPVVPDIGILASRDPVAVDQASVDLVNRQPGIPGSFLTKGTAPGEDKFTALYPKIDWTIQLDHAEQIGLGRRNYRLVTI